MFMYINKLSVTTQASISSFFKKYIQLSAITPSKESNTTILPSPLTVSLTSAASSQTSTTFTSQAMMTPTSTCQMTPTNTCQTTTPTSTCQTTTPTNTCQTTTSASTCQTTTPTNTCQTTTSTSTCQTTSSAEIFQISPPSTSSVGQVGKCGCGNSCTALRKCCCRQKGQLCSKNAIVAEDVLTV